MYLNLLDETEKLSQLFEGKFRDNLDRSLWLSLPDDTDVTRNSWQRIVSVPETRLNYTVMVGSECSVLFMVLNSDNLLNLGNLSMFPSGQMFTICV